MLGKLEVAAVHATNLKIIIRKAMIQQFWHKKYMVYSSVVTMKVRIHACELSLSDRKDQLGKSWWACKMSRFEREAQSGSS